MDRASRGNRPRLNRQAAIAATAVVATRALLDLLLPVCCAVCGRLIMHRERGIVCGHCWTLARELPHPRCERCGHPRDGYSCRWCPLLPAFVRAARSFCWIGAGTGKDIVHSLKYEGWTRVAEGMAERMSRIAWPEDVMLERTAIVPVPLSRSRQRERGFNQSEVISRYLAGIWRIPVWDGALERAASSRSQTELTPGERLSNVAGAFAVPAGAIAMLRGAHIILVDDVVTTGATLRACASALFASGSRTISYMTFGRAPASGDRLTP
ncbi:MAG: ComF family protein [Gemmatimonadales bacterium]